MSVGIVVVSHSAKIAEGVVELAGQMADGVAIVAAGGTDEGGIGTSFDKVGTAIGEADSGEGVVILCDLGSAIMTAETALDFLDDADRARVVIADAPIVEGAVAAAVAARTGGDRDAVLAAAQTAGGGSAEAADLAGVQADAATASTSSSSDDGAAVGGAGRRVRHATLVNGSGLHARPAAEFVKAASGFDAAITVDGVDAKSLLRIMALGRGQGSELELTAEGPDAAAALDALVALVDSGFGED
ncbi:dihydroxyacetone kinase phosphoryl donor subunit DhaM [Schumannella sp. 10F1B-5-1]|uniref:dihydroxyacetone kinase phosphoryl donor subunit DhaM n=1 Tax=Schumannella sp. 10F1B-5-1 TaxID=2590780 RepID=UPI0011317895|nr:dihydroxyacetone kinase phosphoryl donor subunit DhaM [Schumannella sp. 10F1B-5-1]TPW70900.1 HPr family phosphocarrier protein [Schumannella sp. 10F1B-5-1]